MPFHLDCCAGRVPADNIVFRQLPDMRNVLAPIVKSLGIVAEYIQQIEPVLDKTATRTTNKTMIVHRKNSIIPALILMFLKNMHGILICLTQETNPYNSS